MPNPTIKQITLPSGTTYDIEDSVARAAASGLRMVKCTQASDTPYGVKWMDGSVEITGTLVASDSTTGTFYLVPVKQTEEKNIYAEYVTVVTGVNYSWEKLGDTEIDLSILGDLAYKDSASGTYTPAGSIAVNASSGTGTSYTPEGSVTAPTISVASAGSTASVTPFGTQGSLPALTMTVSEGNLSIAFDQGSLPTAGTAVTVKTGDASYEASTPVFSGTEKKLAFSGTQSTVTVS